MDDQGINREGGGGVRYRIVMILAIVLNAALILLGVAVENTDFVIAGAGVIAIAVALMLWVRSKNNFPTP